MGDFAQEFLTKIDGKISEKDMRTVLKELRMFATEYDIHRKETDITTYNSNIPSCYKTYLVSKKIEGLSSGTLKAYDLCLKNFLTTINKNIRDITANDIWIYLYDYQKRRGISNRTLDGKRLIINTFFEWLYTEGYIRKNICKQVNPIKYEDKEREPLSGVEMELLRYACQSYRDRAIVEMFYSTGCRVSELIILTKNDVDFQTGEVHLFGKGSKHRTSYLNAKAEVALKRYLCMRNDDNNALFITQCKPYRALKKTSVERIIRIIGEHSGIGRSVYPHLIRHTTATDALERDMNITEVQKILGHKKLDTTMIYAKVCQENVRYSHRRYIV